MPDPVDFLIVGGGIAGTTLALELARGGGSVALVERTHIGAGSSSVNAGGVRQQFLQPLNIRLAVETVRQVSGFPATHGEEIAFRQAGYLLIYADAEQEGRLAEAVATQNRWDVPSRLIGPEAIPELVPGLRLDGIRGAAFCPTDGYLDPRALVTAYGRAAQRAGVEIVIAGVESITASAGRVETVVAGRRRFAPGVLVNAAGAWAGKVARLYGGELPITPLKSEVFVLDGAPAAGRLTPMVLDYGVGLTYHTEGRGLLVSAGITATVSDADQPLAAVPDRFDAVRDLIARRLPETAGYGLAQCWAGLVETTPDNNPLVGWTHLENVFTIAGFSGHGICIAPGLAADAARMIRGEQPRLPVQTFDPGRFVSNQALEVESLWTGASTFADR